MSILSIAAIELLVVCWAIMAWSRRGRGYSPDLPSSWQPSRALLRQADHSSRRIRG